MYKTVVTLIFFASGIFTEAFAQNGVRMEIDSLTKIVDALGIASAGKIAPMARISELYRLQDDSVNATDFLDRARTLARNQKDGKYMIHVLNRELLNTVNSYPRNITQAYEIMDSIYAAISKTDDLEAQASGYYYIGYVKSEFDLKYDYSDFFKSLSIAEKLPEHSPEKYTVLYNNYQKLFLRNFVKEKTANTAEYLDAIYQAAEKTGNTNNICYALYVKLSRTLYSPDAQKDTALILQNFGRLEQFISENRNSLNPTFYIGATLTLRSACDMIPDARYRKLLEKHIENCRKIPENNYRIRRMLINFELFDAEERKDFAKRIKLYREVIIPLDRETQPHLVSDDYNDLSSAYVEAGQYPQALEAMNESMKYYKELMNVQIEEQRQLAEVKFETGKKENALKLSETRNMLFLSIAILGISLSIILVIYFRKRHTRIRLQKEHAEQQREIAEQRAKLSEYEKAMAQERAAAANLQVMKKNETLEKITQKTADPEVRKLVKNEYATDKTYADFNKTFGEIHPGFFEALKRKAAPERLTRLELRYCAYIYLQKSNKEIAGDLNVHYGTVKSHKNSLKKKLKIDKNASLEDFIRNMDFMSEV